MGIASSDKNTIRKMSEIEAVIYDRFLSIKCPDEKVNTKILQFLGALTLRPYGCTSVWSANGYIKVKME